MAEPGAQQRSPVVLVIDDEDYVADMIASALEIEGIVAYVAYNGREGLEHAQKFEADLLIIDIMMPYMSGVELIQRLRDLPQHRATPVVLISAGARPQRALPNVTFVAKPFDMNEMLDLAVRSLHHNGSHL